MPYYFKYQNQHQASTPELTTLSNKPQQVKCFSLDMLIGPTNTFEVKTPMTVEYFRP